MRLWAALLLLLLLVAVATTAAVTRQTEGKNPQSDLAARINSACKPGDSVTDWTTGDEFTPVPEGTVKVTCLNMKDQALYYVAVAQ